MQGIVSFYLTSLVVIIVIAAYLLPTLAAGLRHAPDIAAVAVINIALGWTFVGWIVAFAMALRKANPSVVQVFNAVNAPASPPPINGYWAPQHLGTEPHLLPPAGTAPQEE